MSGRNFKIGILLKPWTCSHRISVVFLWVVPKLLGLRPPLFSSICFALVEVSKGSGEVKPFGLHGFGYDTQHSVAVCHIDETTNLTN